VSQRAAIRVVIVAISLAFVVANGVNALNKGGDARDFFDGGRRLLEGASPYANSGPATGFIGPPFQALFFLPFAALEHFSEPVARLSWYALNLLCLAGGLWLWFSAWSMSLERGGIPPARRAWFWLALLAVLLPLQTNFEHQNMNALLLAATGAAARSLALEKEVAAAAAIGFATALKAFPAALIAYLAWRRRWRACLMAVSVAGALSVLPAVVYGSRQLVDDVRTWLRLSSGGWPTRSNNQSLIAAIDRALGGDPGAGVHSAADAPAAVLVCSIVALALLAALLTTMARRAESRAPVPCELTSVLTLAILLSPIAWDHYWLLLFPAFLLVGDSSRIELLGRRGAIAFWVAAVLTSGISGATAGRAVWSMSRHFSNSTVAALLLFVFLLALQRRLNRLSEIRRG
jgi:alpha-1,2-mannosyltransferase